MSYRNTLLNWLNREERAFWEHASDLSEFDRLKGKSSFEVSSNGLNKVIKLLDKHKVKATFFVTGVFAEHNK